METWSSTWIEWLLRSSWQASILIGLVLIAQWLLGKKLSPAWRYNLWLLVVVRLILPSSPETSFSLFNVTPPIENLTQRLASLAPREAASPDIVADSSLPLNGSTSADEFNGTTVLTSQPGSFDFDAWAAHTPHATLQRIAAWAVAVWLVITALLLLRSLVQNALFYRKLSLAEQITDPAVIRLLDGCRAELRLRFRPLLIETDLVPAPAVYGIFRPRILLPRGATDAYSHDELRHIFLHELAHIKRLDPAVNCLLGLVRIIHWFNPIVWVAAERMRADREVACDALALRQAGDSQRRQYGETILKILNTLQQPRLRPGLLGIIERKHQLERRITMIAQSQNSSHSLMIATALIVSLAAATLTDAQSPNEADPASVPAPVSTAIDQAPNENQILNPLQTPQSASTTSPGPINGNRGVFPGGYDPTIAATGQAAPAQSKPIPGALEAADPQALFTRTFRVDSAALEASMTHIQPPIPSDDAIAGQQVHHKLARMLRAAGIDFLDTLSEPPKAKSGRALYYNDRSGVLLVRATLAELGTIEEILQVLNTRPPQVVLEAKLVEISTTDNKALGFDWFLGETTIDKIPNGAAPGQSPGTSPGVFPGGGTLNTPSNSPTTSGAAAPRGVGAGGTPGTVSGILTDPQFRVVARALEQRSGVKTILAPKVITLSGRETHISIPQEGFLLKATPSVGADGYSIQLSLSLELQLDKSTGARPARFESTVVVWDGQSVVLGGIPKGETVTENGQTKTLKKNVVLFVTPTIVDPAGNRVNPRE